MDRGPGFQFALIAGPEAADLARAMRARNSRDPRVCVIPVVSSRLSTDFDIERIEYGIDGHERTFWPQAQNLKLPLRLPPMWLDAGDHAVNLAVTARLRELGGTGRVNVISSQTFSGDRAASLEVAGRIVEREVGPLTPFVLRLDLRLEVTPRETTPECQRASLDR